MAANIFATHAPLYWAAGLPAIPLVYENKRPAIQRWQMYSDAFPTEDERKNWLSAYASGNIGLPMGPAAGLVAIDIDTEDAAALAVLDRVLPPSPWHRVGKKGRVQIYRWTNERTARIKDEDGNMICEILSKGTQFVLPPSIHPDTKMPYTADGNLWEIAKNAPPLPFEFEKVLKSALKEAGIKVSSGSNNKTTSWVPAGARDATMVGMAGILSRAVLRGERSLLQVLGEMKAWVENFVEQVVGDPLTVEKAQAKVVEFLVKDVTSEARKALPLGWNEGLSEEDLTKLGLTFTEDDESWAMSKIMDYLAAEFERHPEVRDPGRMNAINVALDRIVRTNPPLNPLEEGMVLKFINQYMAGTMSITDLKKLLNTLRRGEMLGETHAEIAEACLRYLEKYGDIRYDASYFWQWRGASWVKCSEQELLKIIAQEYGAYPSGRRQSDHSGILRVMKALATAPLRSSYTKGVNFANGFLTENLELVPHAPEYGMTYTLPYRYMPERAGHMPMFDQFLNDCWASDPDYGDKLLCLQEMLGVSLMGKAPQFQKAFLLFGQAGAGKSVLASILKGLLPENSWSAISPSDWGDRFLPAEMFGSVVNFAGELSEDKKIPGDAFKRIVAGEEIPVQFKNQSPFTFNPECAQWFNANFLPKSRDSSDGFNRRWQMLEFNNRISPDKQIRDLDLQILELEREAIVAWAVQGYSRLLQNGDYTTPTSHLALIDQMAADNNSVRFFLTSPGTALKWGVEHSISLPELHTAHWQFMVATGTSTRIPITKFANMMKELAGKLPFQVEIRGQSEVHYLGVGI